MDSRRRSVAKAVSYRLIGTVITVFIAWFVTGQASKGLQIGLVDAVAKLLGYFLHERMWARISYGAPKPPEYEI